MSFTTVDYAFPVEDKGAAEDVRRLAEWVYPRVFRDVLAAPGFALVIFPSSVDSVALRRTMVELKRNLSDLHRQRCGAELCYRSMGRFNQQTTTRFHLDGAPDQSFLMLGYEPTAVESDLAMADYTRAAWELRLSPAEYLDRYNPMFPAHESRLQGYITRLTAFDRTRPQILCINNSRQGFHPGSGQQLGVFHQASIPQPRPDAARVVNSTMIAACPDANGETLSWDSQLEFIQTPHVSGSPYN